MAPPIVPPAFGPGEMVAASLAAYPVIPRLMVHAVTRGTAMAFASLAAAVTSAVLSAKYNEKVGAFSRARAREWCHSHLFPMDTHRTLMSPHYWIP